MQDLHGVTNGNRFVPIFEVAFDLGETADISGGDKVWLRGKDGFSLLFPEGFRDFGLVDVVGAGGTATEVGVRSFDHGDSGDTAEERAGLRGDALRIRKVACVLIGDRSGSFTAWKRFEIAQLVKESRHIHDPMPKGLCPFLPFRPFEDEVVFVESGTASGGVGDDGVNVLSGKSIKVLSREFLGGLEIADMPRKRSATALGFRDNDLDPIPSQNLDRGGIDIRVENLLGATGEQSDTRSTRTGRRGKFRPFLSRRQLVGQELEHRPKGCRHEL